MQLHFCIVTKLCQHSRNAFPKPGQNTFRFQTKSTIITLKIERETQSKTCVTHKSSQRWQQLRKYFLVTHCLDAQHSLHQHQHQHPADVRRCIVLCISSHEIDTYEKFSNENCERKRETHFFSAFKKSQTHSELRISHTQTKTKCWNFRFVINTLPHKCSSTNWTCMC